MTSKPNVGQAGYPLGPRPNSEPWNHRSVRVDNPAEGLCRFEIQTVA